MKYNLIIYPQTQQLDPSQPKEPWYNDKDFCDFYRVKGHPIIKCMKSKDYVQDLIDHEEITVGAQTSPNVRLSIY